MIVLRMLYIYNILVNLIKINDVDYKTVKHKAKQEYILDTKITIKFTNIFKYA